jgi:uncharacterized protein (TIGR02265 family)
VSVLVLPALAPVAQVVRPLMPDADKVFRYPAEDLLGGLPTPLTARQQAAFQAEFGAVLGQSTHSALTMVRIIDWVAAVAYPDLPPAEGRRRHGKAGMLVWSRETILGRVMTAALPLMGLERALRRLPQNMGGLTNFATRTVYREGPGHWWYATSDDPSPPEWIAGVTDALAEFTGTRQLQIQWATPSSHERIFEIRWTS